LTFLSLIWQKKIKLTQKIGAIIALAVTISLFKKRHKFVSFIGEFIAAIKNLSLLFKKTAQGCKKAHF